MLHPGLILRSLAASRALLLGCGVMLFAFIWLRVWVASQIDGNSVLDMFESLPSFFGKLLPVPIDALAAPLGRVAFGYEELPVVLMAALWAVSRGSDCFAGRIGDGTMEMLLAQPLRRLTIANSHTAVSILGVILLGGIAWLSTTFGIATSKFEIPPSALSYWPSTINFVGIGVFLLGMSTLVSALASSRAQAVAIMVGFYFSQIAFKIVGLLSADYALLKKFSFLTAYEPTLLTVGIPENSEKYLPMFWQYNAILYGLGAMALIAATTIFCKRDVPAPL
ncbi:MAG: ABC transporter permease subunit [Lacipirellulaceae bacterium]